MRAATGTRAGPFNGNGFEWLMVTLARGGNVAPNDGMRVPVEDAYVASIGRATYVFATLEWNAVWCCERMKPSYVRKLKKKTAGAVAGDFEKLAGRHPDVRIRKQAIKAAKEFSRMVEIRNALLHAKPGTEVGGAQRLFDKGRPWSVATIDAAADDFAECSIRIAELLHGSLSAG